jgi:hypothetical protein
MPIGRSFTQDLLLAALGPHETAGYLYKPAADL